MKSKTSLFNPTIFYNFLRRYWLMWVFYFGLLLFSIGIPLLNSLQQLARSPGMFSDGYISMTLMGSAQFMPLIISLLGCAVIAAISFSYLYNTRHTGMMNSLPIRRETLFFTVLTADLAGLLLADLLLALLCLVMMAVFGAVEGYALGILLLTLVLENVAFMGFAVFCCMLTGNVFAGPAVYLIFNFTGPAVEFMSRYLLGSLQYGNPGPAVDYTQWLSPPYMIASALRYANVADTDTYRMIGMGMLAAYALAGAVFAGLAMVLYRKRRMETAGDVVAIEFLKPVFKVCASLAGALGVASLVRDTLSTMSMTGTAGLLWLCALMVLGGLVGWFIAQMLVEKTIHVFHHGWKGVGIMSLLFILFLCGGEFDWYGYEKNVPDTGEVASVSVSSAGVAAFTLEGDDAIGQVTALHRSIVANKAHHEQVERDMGARSYIRFHYSLDNGGTLVREYQISTGEDAYLDHGSDLWLLEGVVNTKEAVQKRYVMEMPVTAANVMNCDISYCEAETMEWIDFYDLSPADVAELYNECILPDIADGTLGYLNVVENDAYAESKYQCSIRMEFRWPMEEWPEGAGERVYRTTYGGDEHYYKYFTLYLTKSAARTVQFLNDHGIFPTSVQEAALAEGAEYTPSGYVINEYQTDYPQTIYDVDVAFTQKH